VTRRVTPALCAGRRARGILATLLPGDVALIPLDGGRYWLTIEEDTRDDQLPTPREMVWMQIRASV